MAAYDDLNVKQIFVVGIGSIVVTAVTALAVQVVYYWLVQWQDAETQAASNYGRQNRILAEQQAEISSYGVDEGTGNIVVPIEVAMEQMIQKSSKASSSVSTSENARDET